MAHVVWECWRKLMKGRRKCTNNFSLNQWTNLHRLNHFAHLMLAVLLPQLLLMYLPTLHSPKILFQVERSVTEVLLYLVVLELLSPPWASLNWQLGYLYQNLHYLQSFGQSVPQHPYL